MKLHFRTQWNILNRFSTESGLNPVLAWIVAIIVFVFFTHQLFIQYEHAAYVYVLIAAYFALRMSDARRNEFLQICFGKRKCMGLRLVENSILSIPFFIGLILYNSYFLAAVLILLNLALAFVKRSGKGGYAFPTPFKRYSFEYVVGFRKTFWICLLSHTLAGIAIVVGNAHIGIFALVIGLLNTLSFFSYNEDKYYVWVYAKSPQGFLLQKLATAIFLNILLYSTLSLVLVYFFSEQVKTIAFLNVIGNILLSFMILLKYAAFPNQISLKENISLALSIFFPPILIFFFPYYYNQSLKSLKTVLK